MFLLILVCACLRYFIQTLISVTSIAFYNCSYIRFVTCATRKVASNVQHIWGTITFILLRADHFQVLNVRYSTHAGAIRVYFFFVAHYDISSYLRGPTAIPTIISQHDSRQLLPHSVRSGLSCTH